MTFTIEGRLTKVEVKDVRKKDSEARIGTVVVKTEDGERVTVVGHESIVDGLRPDDWVTVKFISEQTTLREPLGDGE